MGKGKTMDNQGITADKKTAFDLKFFIKYSYFTKFSHFTR